jgi:hypothetical protein
MRRNGARRAADKPREQLNTLSKTEDFMKSKQQTTNTKNTKLARFVRSFNQLSKANQKVIANLIKAHLDVEAATGARRLQPTA